MNDINYKLLAEQIFFKRLITEVYPTGIVSLVADTFNFWDAITKIAPKLKQEILARKPNAIGQAKVVFRPDSGNPVEIICGLRVADFDFSVYDLDSDEYDVVKFDDKYFRFEVSYDSYEGYPDAYHLLDEVPLHEVKGAVECLYDIFGGDITSKGFKTLNQAVGLIYGDSITLERQEQILERLAKKNFSAGNIVFGVGSYTYQHVTRDTFGMAMKATFGVVNGESRELFKDPATDTGGTKKSAKGLLQVQNNLEGGFTLRDQVSEAEEMYGALQPVFKDGVLLRKQTLPEIRQILADS